MASCLATEAGEDGWKQQLSPSPADVVVKENKKSAQSCRHRSVLQHTHPRLHQLLANSKRKEREISFSFYYFEGQRQARKEVRLKQSERLYV